MTTVLDLHWLGWKAGLDEGSRKPGWGKGGPEQRALWELLLPTLSNRKLTTVDLVKCSLTN